MRSKLLTIIAVGITLGFLLGMGVVALGRAMLDWSDTGLEIAFTLLVTFMGAMLISYLVQITGDDPPVKQ
jgi:NhaP-type Na+/H+ or K+/H+ antiporter